MNTMPTPPPLKRSAYHVWLAPAGTDPDTVTDEQAEYHHVVVHHSDQLRAELEAGQLGLRNGGKDTPMHVVSLWLWAALVRMGVVNDKYKAWQPRCLAYDPDKDRDQPHTDPDAELDDLDAHPTPASSGSD